LRGLAFLARHDRDQAIAQFRAAVTGIERQPITLLHPLAHLHLARTLRAGGDLPGAREEYARVTAAWKAGDAGHQLVAAAAREAAALNSAMARRPARQARRMAHPFAPLFTSAV
jgi:hypothetical protein